MATLQDYRQRLAQELGLVRRELLARPSRPVLWLLFVFVCFEFCGMLWDQPGYYGWENDGAAPRGFFGGIAENLIPGRGYRYPLFHYLLIGIVNLPVLIVAALVAAYQGQAISLVVVGVPTMTAIAVMTKLLHLALAMVGLLAAERIWRRLFGARTAVWALLFTVANLTVAYYSRVTNVDIVYLMWVTLAMERVLLIAEHGLRRHYSWFAVFAALGLATKDQAYAPFVLLLPIYLLWLPGAFASSGRSRQVHLLELMRALAWSLGTYVVASGALFNPTGFMARVAMLTGTNSQDWRQYPPGWRGMVDNAADLIRLQPEFFWPSAVVVVSWLGVVIAPWVVRRLASGSISPWHWIWGWFPLVAGLSSTLAFTLVVGRAEHRFLLVLGYWLSGYAGVCVAAALDRLRSPLVRHAATVAGGALVMLGVKQNLELLFTQWTDPRREVEAYLADLPPGTRVETYGLGVYLPRFDLGPGAKYSTTRVSARSWGKPPLIVGMNEVYSDFRDLEQRRPDVIVLPEGFASRFRGEAQPGRGDAMAVYRDAPGAHAFFKQLLNDNLPGYTRVAVGQNEPPGWYAGMGGRLLEVHGSTGRPVWVYTRTRPRLSEVTLNVPEW